MGIRNTLSQYTLAMGVGPTVRKGLQSDSIIMRSICVSIKFLIEGLLALTLGTTIVAILYISITNTRFEVANLLTGQEATYLTVWVILSAGVYHKVTSCKII